MHTRLALFHRPGFPFDRRSLPLPVPGVGEILVRITLCTVCGSDVHTWQGRRGVAGPTVLGHEIVGQIEAFGPEAPRQDALGALLTVGTRISWAMPVHCRACFYCLHGLPQKCEKLIKFGHEPFSSARPLCGGLAGHCLLPAGTTVVRLPDALPDALAAPLNCATATVAALFRAAGRCESLLIQGAGALGLTACAWAATAGMRTVVCCDVAEPGRDRALRFGATHTAAPSEVPELVARLTAGRGVDAAMDLCGVPEAIEASLPLVRIGGTLVLAGTVFPTRAISLDPETAVRRLLHLVGVHNYTPEDLVAALHFLRDAGFRFPFAALIGRTFSLEEVDEAFAWAAAHPGERAAVAPW